LIIASTSACVIAFPVAGVAAAVGVPFAAGALGCTVAVVAGVAAAVGVPFAAGAPGCTAAVVPTLLCPKIADAILPKMLICDLQELLGFRVPIPGSRQPRMILDDHAGKAEYPTTDAITGFGGICCALSMIVCSLMGNK
jgi:hypothetical protein